MESVGFCADRPIMGPVKFGRKFAMDFVILLLKHVAF
jgi:hypothetical protein